MYVLLLDVLKYFPLLDDGPLSVLCNVEHQNIHYKLEASNLNLMDCAKLMPIMKLHLLLTMPNFTKP